MTRNKFPAPNRESYPKEVKIVDTLERKILPGKHPHTELRPDTREQKVFTTRPWTMKAALKHVAAGGWFNFTTTQFESFETKSQIVAAQELFSPEGS